MTTLKVLALSPLLLSLTSMASILGAKDKGLTEKDVIRWTKLDEVKKGGDFQATGALYCYKKDLQDWRYASGGVVKNKKGELRILASAHQITENFYTAGKNDEKAVDDNCYFITAKDMWYAIETKGPCGHLYLGRNSKFIKCAVNKGLAYKVSQVKQVIANYGNDLSILKFEDKTPKINL